MWPDEILDIPNSTECPGNSSATDAGSLTVFSDDDAVATDDDEEEHDITYCLRRRAIYFTQAKSAEASVFSA